MSASLAIRPTPSVTARPSYASDYAFGENNEALKQVAISTFIGKPMIRQTRYSVYDYEADDATARADIKSRRIHSKKYNTGLLGMNKVLSADANPDKDHYFFFAYTDGLFYIKYDRDVFSTFNHGEYLRGSREGKVDLPADTMNIPRSLMIEVPM
jgi:hypothetical protein